MINNAFAHDKGTAKVRTIDFNVNEHLREDAFKGDTHQHCGTLSIQGQQFKLSFQELERLSDTLQNSKDVIYKKHKLGLL